MQVPSKADKEFLTPSGNDLPENLLKGNMNHQDINQNNKSQDQEENSRS
jgi:hypothetical protein